jgi:mRNA-degrading endonuclease toxin of MazEF toxin-antitoxin module
MTDDVVNPQRGEIWDVNFDPTDLIGSEEIEKTRPAVVISDSELIHIGFVIVVPITNNKGKYKTDQLFFNLPVTPENGLSKHSEAVIAQVRSVSASARLIRKRGEVTPEQLKEIVAAVALCIGYQ